ncbi:hypothetical protein BU24DRAFT_496814 [Aaosphaeria arxii CBS 175.79]|uniref:Uncharacterized protein n=1 Tax=Aaosphaeria arxii CBS 175.79 TaxID=1450172 RepID=A0A6A5XB32_9PLEO|nr:uncharacterized protein BU24DRAFT_496814 [Aaosphaeria arxii CBS 175.79]KAF2009997.1 hypothetical protein BU24DRAFT_496814 [Aaosphaeria arxii CBS 175.79]
MPRPMSKRPSQPEKHRHESSRKNHPIAYSSSESRYYSDEEEEFYYSRSLQREQHQQKPSRKSALDDHPSSESRHYHKESNDPLSAHLSKLSLRREEHRHESTRLKREDEWSGSEPEDHPHLLKEKEQRYYNPRSSTNGTYGGQPNDSPLLHNPGRQREMPCYSTRSDKFDQRRPQPAYVPMDSSHYNQHNYSNFPGHYDAQQHGPGYTQTPGYSYNQPTCPDPGFYHAHSGPAFTQMPGQMHHQYGYPCDPAAFYQKQQRSADMADAKEWPTRPVVPKEIPKEDKLKMYKYTDNDKGKFAYISMKVYSVSDSEDSEIGYHPSNGVIKKTQATEQLIEFMRDLEPDVVVDDNPPDHRVKEALEKYPYVEERRSEDGKIYAYQCTSNVLERYIGAIAEENRRQELHERYSEEPQLLLVDKATYENEQIKLREREDKGNSKSR